MNRRNIPVRLLEHLQQATTTTARLLKIVARDGSAYGLCMLDIDIDYDDGVGHGEITYSATNGFDPSTLSTDLGFAVSNAEGYALISQAGVPGVNVEMVDRGELDDATWVLYLVNFEDLTMGHIVLDAGDLGEVRTQYGMVWIPELLSYGMRLKQSVGSVWSRKCRAIFGTPKNSQTGCGVELGPLWSDGEVTAVSAEPDLIFIGDVVTPSGSIVPAPGRVQFTAGQNAGKEFAIEAVDGDEVTLAEPTPYPIEVGDLYRIRPDCAKRYLEDCIDKYDNGVNFKGEPLIPVGDASAIQAPGAQLPGGGGFGGGQSGNQVSEE